MMKLKNNTAQGWIEGGPGDGVVLNFLGTARARVQTGKSPTIQTDGGGSSGVIPMDDGYRIRKLTERECMRLMAYTDEEIDRLKAETDAKGRPVYPRTTIYRFAGNSVVVDCFRYITEAIIDDMSGTGVTARQSSLDAFMEGSL